MQIKNIHARQILDSRGHPTVEVDLITTDNKLYRSSVPSGASTGSREALELRDMSKLFNGYGVLKAISNINEIITPSLIGKDPLQHEMLDQLMIDMDGTSNKSNIGANATLAVSEALIKAAAGSMNLPIYKYIHDKYCSNQEYILPVPCMNMMNGGKHALNSSDFQEYMLIPFASTYKEAIETSAKVFYAVKNILLRRNLSTLVGDEGGFAPVVSSNRAPLEILCEGIESAGYKVGEHFGFAMDPAASSFVKEDINSFSYQLKCENMLLNEDEMISYYEDMINAFPIVSLEDGMSENNWNGWKKLKNKIDIQIVGDDLFVTNIKLIKKGHELNCANAVLIKPNQIGTIKETIDAIQLAKSYNWHCMISHRSGETEDSFISDLAVGMNVMQQKSGSLSRSERLAKYNQLLRIEEELGTFAQYKGKNSFKIN